MLLQTLSFLLLPITPTRNISQCKTEFHPFLKEGRARDQSDGLCYPLPLPFPLPTQGQEPDYWTGSFHILSLPRKSGYPPAGDVELVLISPQSLSLDPGVLEHHRTSQHKRSRNKTFQAPNSNQNKPAGWTGHKGNRPKEVNNQVQCISYSSYLSSPISVCIYLHPFTKAKIKLHGKWWPLYENHKQNRLGKFGLFFRVKTLLK